MNEQRIPEVSAEITRAEWVYTPGDFISGQMTHFLTRWFVLTIYAVNLVAASAVATGIFQRGFQVADLKVVGWLSVWFVLLPLLSCWSGWSLYRNLASAGRSTSWAFSPANIQVQSGLGSATFSWEALRRVVETRRAFHIFPQTNLFHIVPKRGFASEDSIQAVRDLMVSKLARRARVKRSSAAQRGV